MTVVSEPEPAELPERWSAKAKIDVVLRSLRGKSVEAVSRELQVPRMSLQSRAFGRRGWCGAPAG